MARITASTPATIGGPGIHANHGCERKASVVANQPQTSQDAGKSTIPPTSFSDAASFSSLPTRFATSEISAAAGKFTMAPINRNGGNRNSTDAICAASKSQNVCLMGGG